MKLLTQIKFLLDISLSHGIIRRYFVVNGFDGALTILGLIVGFLVSTPAELSVVISVCLAAGISLGVSGVSSAYISESAERVHAHRNLEKALVSDLRHSAHAEAARWIPLIVAAVNGAAPFVVCCLILTPLWLYKLGIPLPAAPLYAAAFVALSIIFLFGVFLGHFNKVSWLYSGFQTLLTALATATLIYLFVG